MELVANVWPVVDAASGMVQRFYLRPYALSGSDETICRTLRALAPEDFRMARLFAVPRRYRFVTQFRSMAGAIHIAHFNEQFASVVADALTLLEQEAAGAIGFDMTASGDGKAVAHKARFPDAPYLVITPLLESTQGHLVPQRPKRDAASG